MLWKGLESSSFITALSESLDVKPWRQVSGWYRTWTCKRSWGSYFSFDIINWNINLFTFSHIKKLWRDTQETNVSYVPRASPGWWEWRELLHKLFWFSSHTWPCSGIIPGELRGLYMVPGLKPKWPQCQADVLTTLLLLQLSQTLFHVSFLILVVPETKLRALCTQEALDGWSCFLGRWTGSTQEVLRRLGRGRIPSGDSWPIRPEVQVRPEDAVLLSMLLGIPGAAPTPCWDTEDWIMIGPKQGMFPLFHLSSLFLNHVKLLPA